MHRAFTVNGRARTELRHIMNVKNTLLILTTAILIGTSCTSAPATSVQPPELMPVPITTSTSSGPYRFNIATGSPGSEWHTMGSALIAAINQHAPDVLVSMKETKSLMENVDLLTADKAMAFVYDYQVLLANQGRLMTIFPDAPIEKLSIKCGTEITRPMFPDYAEPARIVLPLYEQKLLLVASSTSSITSLQDLKGKHISTGEPDSAVEQQARFVINGMGLDWDTDISREQFDLTTSIDTLKNGHIDAFFWSGPTSSREIVNLLNAQMLLIPINGADAEKITSLNPGIFHQSTIPAGTYSGLNDDINTLATTVVLAAMDDFPASHIKNIVSTMLANSEEQDSWLARMQLAPREALMLLTPELKAYLHSGLIEQDVLK